MPERNHISRSQPTGAFTENPRDAISYPKSHPELRIRQSGFLCFLGNLLSHPREGLKKSLNRALIRFDGRSSGPTLTG